MSDVCHAAGGFVRDGETVLNGHLLQLARQAEAATALAWINDQAGRAQFAAGLLLANLQQRPCLLPASDAPEHRGQLQSLYPGAQVLQLPPPSSASRAEHNYPAWQATQDAVVCFTSGSTGQPKAIAKSWSALRGCMLGMAQAAAWQPGRTHIVATVPPQHMFGLEMSVLSALICGCRVHDGKPFYPQDVLEALASLPQPRVLVSTPLHLRALLKSKLPWPKLSQIISATAPISPALARAVEEASQGQLLEVLIERESLQSTGIGEGVAIPHGKLAGIDQLMAGFARSSGGVDFDSIDGEPTNLFFLLVVPEQSGGNHLKALARLSRFLRDDSFRKKLVEASTVEDVLRAVGDEDEKI